MIFKILGKCATTSEPSEPIRGESNLIQLKNLFRKYSVRLEITCSSIMYLCIRCVFSRGAIKSMNMDPPARHPYTLSIALNRLKGATRFFDPTTICIQISSPTPFGKFSITLSLTLNFTFILVYLVRTYF